MSRLVQVNVTETRHKTKMLLELTDDEVVDLVSLLESQKQVRPGWGQSVNYLSPRMNSLLHNLQSAPCEVREEKINRGAPVAGLLPC